MSITSSNNLAVNNSLTVNSNTILGVDNTSTLIINSKPTINSDMTISGNINQTNGTITTSSSNINLNGNVIINPTKSLSCGPISCSSINNSGAILCSSINNSGSYNAITCSSINNSGALTQSALAKFSNDIRVNSGQSVYVTDASLSNFSRIHHSGAGGYIDYTGGLNLRNSTTSSASPTDTFNINGSNQGTFNYNLNTTGITNNTNAITNNGVLTQNSTANISSGLNVSGLPYFFGTSANFP